MLELAGEREVLEIFFVVVEKIFKVDGLFQTVFELFGISGGHYFNL